MERKTLLLNAFMIPVGVLHWQDAVKMKYEGTADVMVEYQETVSSPSVTWRVPAVMRLKRVHRSTKRGVKFSRQNVYARDGGRCCYCQQKRKPHELTYDHVVPRASGGRTDWFNVSSSCIPCNARKGSKSCDEAGMWPQPRPYQPKSLPLSGPRIDRDAAPAEWLDYLPA